MNTALPLLPDRLELAARIIRENLPWQYECLGNWIDSSVTNDSPGWMAQNVNIRVKPEPEKWFPKKGDWYQCRVKFSEVAWSAPRQWDPENKSPLSFNVLEFRSCDPPVPEASASIESTATTEELRAMLASERIRADRAETGESSIPCTTCGGPVVEFAVPSPYWNRVVRKNGPETDNEYLCWECFQKAVDTAISEADAVHTRKAHRRHFAGLAMQGLLTADASEQQYPEIARWAVQMADSLLTALEGGEK